MAQDEVLTLARRYANAVRGVLPAERVYLYGSQARGTATKDSDIDIAVVVDSIPADYLDTVALLWRLGRQVDPAIEPVLLTTDDRTTGFLQTIERTGITI